MPGMGREAECLVECGQERDETRVLLEAEGIVLRGPIKGTLRLADLRELQVRDDALEAQTPRGRLRIHLGATEAQRWLQRLTQPPTLAEKLGLRPGLKAVQLGTADPEIAQVLSEAGALVGSAAEAELAFCTVESVAALEGLERLLRPLPASLPIWFLRRKGKAAAVGESTLMAELKRLGYGPAKTARWSEERGADRYHRRK